MLDCKRDLKVQRERMSELEAAAAVRTGGGEGGAAAASRAADLKAVVEHGEELLQWHPDWKRLARTRNNPYRDEIDIFIPPLVRAWAADGKAPAHPHTRTPAHPHAHTHTLAAMAIPSHRIASGDDLWTLPLRACRMPCGRRRRRDHHRG
eukprot:COSAG01_NODE_7084_length_3361_cov_1.822195_3_plen_150_part_00